ncbi:MAG: polysaccharide deacetylase family protein [Armatimonadota bacterium]
MRKLIAVTAFAAVLCATQAGAGVQKHVVHHYADPMKIVKKENDNYWRNARETVYQTVPNLLATRKSELERGLAHAKLMHGDVEKKQIALTFDDGPHPSYTPKILEILRRYHVKATFFLVGELAEKYPRLVKAELGGGHCVGNHTYHHVNLTQIPSVYVAAEIKACGAVLNNIIGRPPHLFRPPGGDYNDQVARVAEALGYNIVLWTDDPADYANPGEKLIEQRTLDKIDNGGIILIHDGIQQTINILPKLLQELKDKGCEFVTVDQMLRNR